jgi:hypothetical protein
MSWEERHADGLDRDIAEMQKYLAEADNAAKLAEAHSLPKLAAELRACSSAVRACVNTFRSEARELRRHADVD